MADSNARPAGVFDGAMLLLSAASTCFASSRSPMRWAKNAADNRKVSVIGRVGGVDRCCSRARKRLLGSRESLRGVCSVAHRHASQSTVRRGQRNQPRSTGRSVWTGQSHALAPRQLRAPSIGRIECNADAVEVNGIGSLASPAPMILPAARELASALHRRRHAGPGCPVEASCRPRRMILQRPRNRSNAKRTPAQGPKTCRKSHSAVRSPARHKAVASAKRFTGVKANSDIGLRRPRNPDRELPSAANCPKPSAGASNSAVHASRYIRLARRQGGRARASPDATAVSPRRGIQRA